MHASPRAGGMLAQQQRHEAAHSCNCHMCAKRYHPGVLTIYELGRTERVFNVAAGACDHGNHARSARRHFRICLKMFLIIGNVRCTLPVRVAGVETCARANPAAGMSYVAARLRTLAVEASSTTIRAKRATQVCKCAIVSAC